VTPYGINDLARVLLDNDRWQDEGGVWREPPAEDAGAGERPRRERTAGAGVVERARRYLEKLPDSVSGQGGHDALWHAALCVYRGFDLERKQARELLQEFSGRCQPPWSDREIEHKLDQVEKKAKAPWGFIVNPAGRVHEAGGTWSQSANGDGRHSTGIKAPGGGEQKPPEPYRVKLIDSPTFEANNYRLGWLVEWVLLRGLACILGGPKKALKTSILVDLALSLAAGVRFLGEFFVPQKTRVCVLSGESGEATLQALARRVAAARGVPWPQVDCFWGFDLPQLSVPEHLEALREALVQHKVEVLIYDPLYLGLLAGQGADGLSAANLYQVGPLLLGVAKTCLDVGVTPILAHHFKITRRDPYAEPQLEDLAFAGVQEFARQWVLLCRRQPFDPEDPEGRSQLWLQAGGSAGHSLFRAVDVCEGRLGTDFSGRTWKVEVLRPADARVAEAAETDGEKERQEQAKDKADDAKVLAAVDRADPRREGLSFTTIRAESRLSTDRARRACRRLACEGILQEVELKVRGGNGARIGASGYRRRPPPAISGGHPEH
jgi:hypothetical protein